MTRPLAAFFTLTFVATWALWALAAVVPASGPDFARAALFLPGTVIPAVAAILVTARHDGRAGVRALLQRLFIVDVGARWFVFAMGYIIVVKLAAAAVHRVSIGEWPAFGATPLVLMLAGTLLSTPVQAGEEIGWRGFALPRMAARMGLRLASLLLGILWAAWHLPLFVIAGTDSTGQSFPVYLVGVTALSVTLAWLHSRTRGSLLLVMLMHAAINNTKDIVPSAGPPGPTAFSLDASSISWISAMLLWIGAAWFLWQMPAGVPAGQGSGRRVD